MYYTELHPYNDSLHIVKEIKLNHKCKCLQIYPCLTSYILGDQPSHVSMLFTKGDYAKNNGWLPAEDTYVHVCMFEKYPMKVIHSANLRMSLISDIKGYDNIGYIDIQTNQTYYVKKNNPINKIKTLPVKVILNGVQQNMTPNFNKTYSLYDPIVQNIEKNNTKYKDNPEYFNGSTIIDRITMNVTKTYTSTLTMTTSINSLTMTPSMNSSVIK